eukprot:3336887-Rhodomonas_salina.2
MRPSASQTVWKSGTKSSCTPAPARVSMSAVCQHVSLAAVCQQSSVSSLLSAVFCQQSFGSLSAASPRHVSSLYTASTGQRVRDGQRGREGGGEEGRARERERPAALSAPACTCSTLSSRAALAHPAPAKERGPGIWYFGRGRVRQLSGERSRESQDGDR